MAKKSSFLDDAVATMNRVASGKKKGRKETDSPAVRRANQGPQSKKKIPARDTSPPRMVGDHPLSGRRRRARLDKAIDG